MAEIERLSNHYEVRHWLYNTDYNPRLNTGEPGRCPWCKHCQVNQHFDRSPSAEVMGLPPLAVVSSDRMVWASDRQSSITSKVVLIWKCEMCGERFAPTSPWLCRQCGCDHGTATDAVLCCGSDADFWHEECGVEEHSDVKDTLDAFFACFDEDDRDENGEAKEIWCTGARIQTRALLQYHNSSHRRMEARDVCTPTSPQDPESPPVDGTAPDPTAYSNQAEAPSGALSAW